MKDNIDEIPSGGVGIRIIGKIADELSYTRYLQKISLQLNTDIYYFCCCSSLIAG